MGDSIIIVNEEDKDDLVEIFYKHNDEWKSGYTEDQEGLKDDEILIVSDEGENLVLKTWDIKVCSNC